LPNNERSGAYFCSFTKSVTIACLCEKVPLSTSCPDNLTLNPSFNKDPKAKLYAVPKSIF